MDDDGFWEDLKKRLDAESEAIGLASMAEDESDPGRMARSRLNSSSPFPEPSLIRPGMTTLQNPLMSGGLIKEGMSSLQNPLVDSGMIKPGMSALQNPLMNEGLIKPGMSVPQNPLMQEGMIKPGMTNLTNPLVEQSMWKDWEFAGRSSARRPMSKGNPTVNQLGEVLSRLDNLPSFLSGLDDRLNKAFGQDGIDSFIEKAGVPSGESAKVNIRSDLFNRNRRLEWK